jgi:sugar transferase (PEP-CTERM/EpsH1 system associated)
MDLIDVDSYKWSQYAGRSPFWTAWIYRHEARVLGSYEKRIAREFDRLLVVSEQERGFFPDGPPANLQAMSNGVDLDYFAPRIPDATSLGTHALVFTGVMDYWPNVEGVTWFVERVLPRVRAALPETHLFIVGSRPVPEIRKLAALQGVTVTGFVTDVRDYIAGASLCVAPLRIARGIQNKVLEAMAMAKAVVATPEAYEGVHAEAGEDIVVAEGEAGFADAVIALLRDRARTERIGENARRCVEQHYTWQGNLSRLHDAGL